MYLKKNISEYNLSNLSKHLQERSHGANLGLVLKDKALFHHQRKIWNLISEQNIEGTTTMFS